MVWGFRHCKGVFHDRLTIISSDEIDSIDNKLIRNDENKNCDLSLN